LGSATGQTLRNFVPAVADALMEIGDYRILLCSPSLAAHVPVEILDPAVTALLTNAPWEKLGALRPARPAFTGNKINDCLVLFAGPWPFHQCRVKSFSPSLANLRSACLKAGSSLKSLERSDIATQTHH
jgi:hypothetical protein